MVGPKIIDCFFRRETDGVCCSPEVYRFVEGMDTGKPCRFNAAETAFDVTHQLRCLEFRPKRTEAT